MGTTPSIPVLQDLLTVVEVDTIIASIARLAADGTLRMKLKLITKSINWKKKRGEFKKYKIVTIPGLEPCPGILGHFW